MEQKRTLWIVSAVGVFLLVVVGAALIMYSPTVNGGNGQKTPSVASSKGPTFNQFGNQFDKNTTLPPPPPQAFGNDGMPLPPPLPESLENAIKSENVTVYAQNATVYGTDGKALDMNELKSIAAADAEGTTINVLPPKSETAIDSSKETKDATVKVEPRVTVKSNVAKAETPKTSSAPKAATKPVAKASAPKPVAKPAPKALDTYWIQIAAYEMKKNADEIRTALENKKIKAEVFTYETKGKLYYRVRVGPYTTKSEAQYWQNQIASTAGIDTKGSYIVAN